MCRRLYSKRTKIWFIFWKFCLTIFCGHNLTLTIRGNKNYGKNCVLIKKVLKVVNFTHLTSHDDFLSSSSYVTLPKRFYYNFISVMCSISIFYVLHLTCKFLFSHHLSPPSSSSANKKILKMILENWRRKRRRNSQNVQSFIFVHAAARWKSQRLCTRSEINFMTLENCWLNAGSFHNYFTHENILKCKILVCKNKFLNMHKNRN